MIGSALRKALMLAALPYQSARRIHYDLFPTDLDETACQFVSSRGIAKACHRLHDVRGAHAVRINAHRFAAWDGQSPLYCFTEALPEFIASWLPRIDRTFTLVTGADDLPVDVQTQGIGLSRLLENPFLERWYAQNAIAHHDKLALLPIGLDYHTLAGNHRHPWRRFQTPIDQERELLKVLRAAPPPADRRIMAYSNWHFALDRGDRRDCLEQIDHHCVAFEPNWVSRVQSWRNNATCFFTISPLGNAVDCHRTWEALALGTVPIVRTSPLDPLYAGLPVIIVNEWSQVTPAFLAHQRDAKLRQSFDYSRLLGQYWVDEVRHATHQITAPCPLGQFPPSAGNERSEP